VNKRYNRLPVSNVLISVTRSSKLVNMSLVSAMIWISILTFLLFWRSTVKYYICKFLKFSKQYHMPLPKVSFTRIKFYVNIRKDITFHWMNHSRGIAKKILILLFQFVKNNISNTTWKHLTQYLLIFIHSYLIKHSDAFQKWYINNKNQSSH